MIKALQKRIKTKREFFLKASMSGVIKNGIHQLRYPDTKIFLLGANRCATTTFHSFFHYQGLKSIHWNEGDAFLALEIDKRKKDKKELKKFLSQWTVFSDFTYLTETQFIENNNLYEIYLELYPDAFFILNDRDEERWIESRLKHRDGGFLERYCNLFLCSKEEAVEQWRSDYISHREKTLRFFKGHPRFLHFNIDREDKNKFADLDDVDRLVQFLSNSFSLSNKYWKHYNTARRPKHQ